MSHLYIPVNVTPVHSYTQLHTYKCDTCTPLWKLHLYTSVDFTPVHTYKCDTCTHLKMSHLYTPADVTPVHTYKRYTCTYLSFSGYSSLAEVLQSSRLTLNKSSWTPHCSCFEGDIIQMKPGFRGCANEKKQPIGKNFTFLQLQQIFKINYAFYRGKTNSNKAWV